MILDPELDVAAQLARIDAAQWRVVGFDTHVLVAGDDGEALVVLTARFMGQDPARDLYVIDASDACYVGLDNAKAAGVRALKRALGVQ